MITVMIYINNRPIYIRNAVNVSTPEEFENEKSVNTYRVDSGHTIKHRRKDGAVKLAKKMLNTIKEYKNE